MAITTSQVTAFNNNGVRVFAVDITYPNPDENVTTHEWSCELCHDVESGLGLDEAVRRAAAHSCGTRATITYRTAIRGLQTYTGWLLRDGSEDWLLRDDDGHSHAIKNVDVADIVWEQ
jgi:hypothetical protein